MDSYSAVVTTGIYCRPGCSARPNAGNVRSFAAAAAAEAAGYRACLRCRPYRTPQAFDWDQPELVCRAVQLIVAGALDGSTETQLAARLGVSARHLRRLFETHVGVTPDRLARSRRTHFARRLLDDSDLTVTDIAFAAGFGSVRQLNRACQEVFRATPRQLRARRRRTDRLVADGGLALRLPFAGPLDWDAMVNYFRHRAIPGVERTEGSVYRRTIVVDGDPGVLEVWAGGPDHLMLRAHLPHWEGLIHVVERTRRIFNLDTDPRDAAAVLAGDPVIGPLVTSRPGLRVPGAWDLFEVGVRAIVGQQVTVTGASTITGRLVARHGRPLPGLDAFGLSHTFPAASVLATADLDGLGLTQARQRAIRTFAGAVASGEVALDHSLGLDHLEASITALPGLGPWTAQYVAMRLGERNAFPAGDLGLQRALGLTGPAATRMLGQQAQQWSPWRATAAIHLWLADPGAPAEPQPLHSDQARSLA
ncbi:MAG: Transcriptional regulator, AraC family [Acidimicrobiia bacterium]|nr:Transcriptional regulator, AraC family [Acidimicrobiia bacterium]